ncbi:hypothetical protein IAI18_22020 [Acetobacteraceae bacterium H6797]|nr:hypothetical protein [Acetobacteraceae bacterium H6797]
MNRIKTYLAGFALLGGLVMAGSAVAPSAAKADEIIVVHDGWRHRGPPPRYYYAPPPRPRYYYAPPPRVYYAPPPPVYYAPPPPPRYYAPRPAVGLYFGF